MQNTLLQTDCRLDVHCDKDLSHEFPQHGCQKGIPLNERHQVKLLVQSLFLTVLCEMITSVTMLFYQKMLLFSNILFVTKFHGINDSVIVIIIMIINNYAYFHFTYLSFCISYTEKSEM